MTPVISPWVFYLMPICDNLNFVAALVGFVLVITTIAIAICLVIEGTSRYPNENLIKTLKPVKNKLAVLSVILMLLAIFVPNQETLTKMLIAQNVTYERVEVAANTVESVYNDIMELFDDDGDSE